MPLPLYVVDAFTSRAFAGNPAAVCVLPSAADQVWMQAVAAEMKHSETAFLSPRADGYDLRWFTPETEVDLCGHATLASAHILWQTGRLADGRPAAFHTRSGLLTAGKRGDWVDMDFPALPAADCEPPPELAHALGLRPIYTGKNAHDFIVLLESEQAVRGLSPDFATLASLPVRGVCITAASDSGDYDFVSRFFGPAVGINEDPVTGSAHCCLGPFWSQRLGKKDLVGFQASARGGVVGVRVEGERVTLSGQAVTVLQGELRA